MIRFEVLFIDNINGCIQYKESIIVIKKKDHRLTARSLVNFSSMQVMNNAS
jgi:hypothetical protein